MKLAREHVLDVYGAHLYLATDLKQWRQLRNKISKVLLDKEPGGVGQASIITLDADHTNTPHVPVYIDLKAHADDGAALVNTCAHEATHVAALLLDHVGQEPGNSEALAYLVGWLTEWIYVGCAA